MAIWIQNFPGFIHTRITFATMKYSQWLGILAAAILVVSVFLPWTWYPDLQTSFTGMYSEENIYGRPGRIMIFFACVISIFYLIPRIWAKRWNIFFCSLFLAYAIKTFILFTGCYRGICPEKLAGIWLMMGAVVSMMIAALFPDTPVQRQPKKEGV